MSNSQGLCLLLTETHFPLHYHPISSPQCRPRISQSAFHIWKSSKKTQWLQRGLCELSSSSLRCQQISFCEHSLGSVLSILGVFYNMSGSSLGWKIERCVRHIPAWEQGFPVSVRTGSHLPQRGVQLQYAMQRGEFTNCTQNY